MAFLKRVFSSDYRRALAAEAAGDYLEAARAYALSGEREKVGEMHLLAAERASGREARIQGLRTAARWCAEDTTRPEAARASDVRRRVARALFEAVRVGGVITEGDRAVVREAARLFHLAGDGEGEGEALELCGDEQGAAEAYQWAGDVERLEQVLARGDERRDLERRLREASEEHQRLLATGSRTAALERLRECARLDPSGPSRQLAEALEARRITAGVVALHVEAGRPPILLLGEGAFPIGIGRDPGGGIALRDARVSRRHAEIVERDGHLRLRDAGSRNGTQLAGVTVEGELPLVGQGEIGLGDAVALAYLSDDQGLRLEVTRGTDRGLVAWICTAPRTLAPTLIAATGRDASVARSLRLRFAAGVPTIDLPPEAASLASNDPASALWPSLRLNGVNPRAAVELLHGDHLELGEPGAAPTATLHVEVG